MPEALGDVLDRIEAAQAIELPQEATSLDFLQQVYRNPSLPISTRMRAAVAALQFEHPKLGVNITIEGKDIAQRLDEAIRRSSKVINGSAAKPMKAGKMIEAEAK